MTGNVMRYINRTNITYNNTKSLRVNVELINLRDEFVKKRNKIVAR